jgi:glycosyltransferase involved in cell wall biosynthesis
MIRSEINKKPKLLNIVTDSQSTIFFRGNMGYMKKRGFNVGICSSPGKLLREIAVLEGAEAFEVPIEREIMLIRDILSLLRLVKLIRRIRPTIVNASTAKAGLLGMLAARLSNVPVRVHQQRGLRSETTIGIKSLIIRSTEWLACKCATVVICNSFSLRNRSLSLRLVNKKKCRVLCNGSSGGVDSVRFSLKGGIIQKAQLLRDKYGITTTCPVLGFIGRLVKDKGINDLRFAFEKVLSVFPDARLLLIGQHETGDPVSLECVEWLKKQPNVIFSGYVKDVAPYYALFHVLVFPSYREGFPNSPLEASSMQLPVVGYRSTGVVDAVQDGVTGILVDQGDFVGLAEAIIRYLSDPRLRLQHGQAGRERVVRDFQPHRLWEALYQEYEDQLKKAEVFFS